MKMLLEPPHWAQAFPYDDGFNPAAPRPPLHRIVRHSESRRYAGRRRADAFTLMELMVVMVILGILAATIIPTFVTTTHDAKVNAAKANVSELENALERFHIHMDRYPTTEEGLKVLVEPPSSDEAKKWRGPYISLLRPDPWSHPYQYRNPGVQNKSRYDLWSRGADGVDGGEGDGADIGNW